MKEFEYAAPSRRRFLAASLGGLEALAVERLPAAEKQPDRFEAVKAPAWVEGVTRMAYLPSAQADDAAKLGVQVVYTNNVWPYSPVQSDGGGLPADDDKKLLKFVERCRAHKMRVVLGLPPFPPV